MILSFSKRYMLILTVDTLDLEIMIMTEKFQIMSMMVEYSVMLERVMKRKEELHQIKKKKTMKKGPVAFQGWFHKPKLTRVSLQIADIIDHTFQI